MIGELNMYKESGIKPNFSDIARRYGKDRHTVAAYWRTDGCRPEDKRRDRKGSFEDFKEVIEAKAQLPGATKKGIHEFLLHAYPERQFATYNAFTQFMRKNGIVVGSPGGPEAHPRFETPAGLQLQFDWKESLSLADANGELFEFNVFSATLCWSRRHIFIYSRTKGADDIVRCMFTTILRLGGVPREWLTDNMGGLVAVCGGRRVWNDRILAFAKDAGFEVKACKVRTPQTKGKVESSNRFLSRLVPYQGEFIGEQGLIDVIARIEQRCNDEANATTGMPPSVLFMREKDQLAPIGNVGLLREAMGDVTTVPSVPSTMLVPARGRKVSVPRRCIGRQVRCVTLPGGTVDVWMGDELVATHGPGSSGYDFVHYAEAMEGKRWFGDGDIAAAAAANLELLGSIGGAL